MFFALFFMLLTAFVALGVGIFSFDFLVYKEYKEHYNSWQSDGCPKGFCWKPPNTGAEAIVGKDNSVAWQWFWQQPLWMKNDTEAKWLLLAFRLTYPIGAVLFFSFIVLFFASRFRI
jgi:hypothetical protein